MTEEAETERRESALRGVRQALAALDADALATVLARVAEIPADGELADYVAAVASVARDVVEQLLVIAVARSQTLRRHVDIETAVLAAMNKPTTGRPN